MKNEDVAGMLNEIADILEMRGESTFKVRAYREAARSIEGMHESIAVFASEGRLTEIRGIGQSIAEKIGEFVSTGHSTYYDELSAALPSGMAELLQIPGVGASKVRLFYERLGITTVDQLEEAAGSHHLRNLPGIKEKTEQNVLEGIRLLRQRTSRMLLGLALPAAEEIVEQLRPHSAVERIETGGSIRRMKETVGDIDILISSTRPADAIGAFTALPNVKNILAKGGTKASILTTQDLQVDLRVVPPEDWGAALQYFTGSKDHNIQLRTVAESRRLKVNEYGVFRADTDEKVAGRDEEEVYRILGMSWIPPEIREASGEIEAAMVGRLPRLIEVADIHGDLHAHTDWSDGKSTIEQMAEAARARGYEYLVISDHSASMGFIHGLSPERILEQRQIIDLLNERFDGFRLLQGTEVNILSDGTLDYSDDILKEFDVVTASIHGGLQQSREQITSRMISAIRNPHVDILGHPSGRLINRRDPSDFDLESVITAAVENKTALEINAQPDRLDLKDIDARRAIEMGAMVAIDSDSHDTDQLDYIRYGVATARRGWVTKDRVINAMSLPELLAWLED